MVGMEDDRHPGKLRKFECCPVSSSSNSKSKKSQQKLVKGVAFVGDSDDDDNDDDDYVPDDDFLDDDDHDDDGDDDTDDNNDDHSHHIPSNPDPDQHDQASSPSWSPSQHAQSYDYVSDDEFVTDAGIPHSPYHVHQSHIAHTQTLLHHHHIIAFTPV